MSVGDFVGCWCVGWDGDGFLGSCREYDAVFVLGSFSFHLPVDECDDFFGERVLSGTLFRVGGVGGEDVVD